MAMQTAEEVYEQHVKALPLAERLKLLALTAQDLAGASVTTEQQPERRIMDLHGLGREIWKDVDPQAYVNELRSEWDREP